MNNSIIRDNSALMASLVRFALWPLPGFSEPDSQAKGATLGSGVTLAPPKNAQYGAHKRRLQRQPARGGSDILVLDRRRVTYSVFWFASDNGGKHYVAITTIPRQNFGSVAKAQHAKLWPSASAAIFPKTTSAPSNTIALSLPPAAISAVASQA